MKPFRPPRATVEVVVSIIGRKALRLEHRLCDTMFDIARHSRSVTQDTIRAKAEAKVVVALENAVRRRFPPTQRDWKWDRSQRLALAKRLFGSTFNRELFEEVVKCGAEDCMRYATWRINNRHSNYISNIACGDMRNIIWFWQCYCRDYFVKCSKSDTQIVHRASYSCWMVGHAVFGAVDGNKGPLAG